MRPYFGTSPSIVDRIAGMSDDIGITHSNGSWDIPNEIIDSALEFREKHDYVGFVEQWGLMNMPKNASPENLKDNDVLTQESLRTNAYRGYIADFDGDGSEEMLIMDEGTTWVNARVYGTKHSDDGQYEALPPLKVTISPTFLSDGERIFLLFDYPKGGSDSEPINGLYYSWVIFAIDDGQINEAVQIGRDPATRTFDWIPQSIDESHGDYIIEKVEALLSDIEKMSIDSLEVYNGDGIIPTEEEKETLEAVLFAHTKNTEFIAKKNTWVADINNDGHDEWVQTGVEKSSYHPDELWINIFDSSGIEAKTGSVNTYLNDYYTKQTAFKQFFPLKHNEHTFLVVVQDEGDCMELTAFYVENDNVNIIAIYTMDIQMDDQVIQGGNVSDFQFP